MPDIATPIMPAVVTPGSVPNSITTDRGLLNQQLSNLVDSTSSQSDDLVTALDAIAAAINAKPSS